jgi:hypothetical protein
MPQQARTREIPTWASVLILLLAIAGGAWLLWSYFTGGSGGELPAAAAVKLTDANVDGPPIPGNGRHHHFVAPIMVPGANIPDGIMPITNGYLIKSGVARLNVERVAQLGAAQQGGTQPGGRAQATADWRYQFSFSLPQILAPDDLQTLRAGRRAMFDPSAQALGVTAAQIQQLRDARVGGIGMNVDSADRARIAALFQQWLDARGKTGGATQPAGQPAIDAQHNLLAALADIAAREVEPARKAAAARASQIRTLLGDTVLQKLKQNG